MDVEVFRAMNTDILLLAEGEEAIVQPGFRAARDLIEASERRFTRFSAESELSQMNRAAGKWFSVSEDLYNLMMEAREWHIRTRGLFDPSILPQLRRAGYSVSMDEIRRNGVPARQMGDEPMQSVPFSEVELDPKNHSIRLPAGMQIDLGGIAKGWIAERAAGVLKNYSRACAVNAGGDMFLGGIPEGEEHWEVALEDPRDISQDLAILWAEEGAIATSSVLKRTWEQGGVRQHHLIHPRTGLPAETRWLCVTVMAPRAAQAETLAKAFLLAGEAEAAVMLNENPELTVLAVDHSGDLIVIGGEREGMHVH